MCSQGIPFIGYQACLGLAVACDIGRRGVQAKRVSGPEAPIEPDTSEDTVADLRQIAHGAIDLAALRTHGDDPSVPVVGFV